MARPSRWHGQPFKGKRTERKKNGVTYIYEQLYQYDPVAKKTKVVDSKLIGKIMPGTDQIVRTRPKKPSRATSKRAKPRTGAKAISPANPAVAPTANINELANKAANTNVPINTLDNLPTNNNANETASLDVNSPINNNANETASLEVESIANKDTNETASLDVNLIANKGANSSANKETNETASLDVNSTANPHANETITAEFPFNMASTTMASRMHVGACEILEWAAKESGIGEDVKYSLPEGEALKALSLANYLCATGATLPGFESWQLTHPIPYGDGISEETYGKLFTDIGDNESWVQSYFERRASRLSPNPALALDSTSISTYSQELNEARYGYSQEDDGLPVIKYCTLYSVKDCQPIAYADKPGNIPDVITLNSSLKQLESLGVSNAMVVTDCGYASVSNIEEFFRSHKKFLTLVRRTLKWVKDVVEEVLPRLGEFSTIYPLDPTVYGAVVEKEVEFNLTRKRSRGEKKAGEKETVKRRLYIGVYRNTQVQEEEKKKLYSDILATKEKWESGERQFEGPRKHFFERYFTVSTMGRGGREKLLVNEKAFNDAVKYMGVFVLVSNKSMDAFEMLRTYRLREKCECTRAL